MKNELYHHGVKGMRWGKHVMAQEYEPHPRRRVTRNQNGSGSRDWLTRLAEEGERLQRTAAEAETIKEPVNNLIKNPNWENVDKTLSTYYKMSPEAQAMVKSVAKSTLDTMRNRAISELKETMKPKNVAKNVAKFNMAMFKTAGQTVKDAANTRTTRTLTPINRENAPKGRVRKGSR